MNRTKNREAVFFVVLTFLMAVITIAPTHLFTVASGSSSFQFVLGTSYYSYSDVAIPHKGVMFTDPNFHASITRITDKSDGYSDGGIENEYARSDPENCNRTYVILRANDGECYLYDTATFQMQKHLAGIMFGEEPEPRWDASNPKIFYYVYGTELRSYNIDTDVSTTVHDFKTEFPSASYITTKVEGDASLDRRYWSFMVEDSNYDLISVIVFDKASNSVVGQRNSFRDSLDWVSMDMSGKHCIIGYDTHVSQVFSRDLSSALDLTTGANGHMDLALTSDGKDVMVYQNNANDWIAMADLDTAVETQLVKIPFNVTEDIGMHFSGNCGNTPGWILVSTYGAKNPPKDETHSWMDTQLFMVQLQANPTIWRIANTHAYTSLDYSGDKNYFAESFASINTEGTKIYFGSNWGNFKSDYTDAYVVSLPQDWFSSIPSSNVPSHTPSPVSSNIPEFPSLLVVTALFVLGTLITACYVRKRTEKK